MKTGEHTLSTANEVKDVGRIRDSRLVSRHNLLQIIKVKAHNDI